MAETLEDHPTPGPEPEPETGAEPPTRIKGGAVLGGIGAARPAEIGEVTEYVLRKAPCRVLVTAPPS